MDHGQLKHSIVDVDGLRKSTTHGNTKLHPKRVCIAYGDGSIAMGDRKYAAALDMSELRYRLQGFDRHDRGTPELARLCDGTRENKDTQDMLPGVQDYPYPKGAKPDLRFIS